MSLLKNKVKFPENKISNPDIYNYNLGLFRDDVDLNLLRISQIEESITKYIAIYDEDYIEQLRYKIKRLQNQIEALGYLNSNNQYSSVIRYDFSSSSEYSNNQQLYQDPKSFRNYTAEGRLVINPQSSSLQSPSIGSSSIDISRIDIGAGATNEYDFGKSNDTYNFYMVKNDAKSIQLSVDIYLTESSDVNSISFDHVSEFPYNLLSVSKGILSGNNMTWTAIGNTSKNGIYDYTTLFFPSETVNAVRLTFELTQCKVTNRYYSSSDNLIDRLLSDYQSYLDLDIYSDSTISLYTYKIFHFGIKDISVSLGDRSNSGIFASQSNRINEPAQFRLEAIETSSNTSIEYYMHKKDYSPEGIYFKGSEITIPLLPFGVNSIANEALIPVNPAVFGIDNGSIEAAKINFSPDPAQTISVYENGLACPISYTVNDEFVEFAQETDPNAFYTINYTPYHLGREFFTPVTSPSNVISKTFAFDSSTYKIVDIDITDLGGGDYQIDEVVSGSKYIKYMLPFTLEFSTAVINRIFNGSIDTDIPEYILSGVGQNVFMVGRTLYVPFDAATYPKLYNSSYTITGELYKTGLTDDTLHYYGMDSSLIINWDAFTKRYGSSYGYSLFELIIVARSYNNSTSFLEIKDVYLYSNKFNDLIIEPNQFLD